MPPLIGEKPLTPAERQRRYRERHAERVRESQQRWLADNPERRKEVSRAHYARNAESEKARALAWRAANPKEWRRIANAAEERRRAAKAGAGVFVILPRELRRLYNSPCAECGSTDSPTIDHIVPLSRGGRHSVGNLQTLCASCNYSKNSKLTVEWRARKRLVQAA